MKSRYADYPESWVEFVSIVKSMIRGDEGAWFLCSEAYDAQGDKAWQWNERELLSLDMYSRLTDGVEAAGIESRLI